MGKVKWKIEPDIWQRWGGRAPGTAMQEFAYERRPSAIHEQQIIGVPKEAKAAAKSKQLCRRRGICELPSFYKWKVK
jgi:hypothetical protein